MCSPSEQMVSGTAGKGGFGIVAPLDCPATPLARLTPSSIMSTAMARPDPSMADLTQNVLPGKWPSAADYRTATSAEQKIKCTGIDGSPDIGCKQRVVDCEV